MITPSWSMIAPSHTLMSGIVIVIYQLVYILLQYRSGKLVPADAQQEQMGMRYAYKIHSQTVSCSYVLLSMSI